MALAMDWTQEHLETACHGIPLLLEYQAAYTIRTVQAGEDPGRQGKP